MTNFSKKIGISTLAVLAGVSAAGASYAETGGMTLLNPSSFNGYLAKYYGTQAAFEKGDSTDQIDAHVLSDRAISASNGNQVVPLTVDQVIIPSQAHADELNAGRTRLMRVLGKPEKIQQHTADVAKAQVSYDCWAVQQQSGPNASHNMKGGCKRAFIDLINQLDTPDPVVAVVPAAPVRYEVVNASNVYFAWDKADLSSEAKAVLDEVKRKLKNPESTTLKVALEGFADRSGPADYNQKLSERRVKAVVDYLGETPVDNAQVDVQAFGETNLPVATADGVREAANRTVKVSTVREKVRQPAAQ